MKSNININENQIQIETRVALLGIIVSNPEAVENINELLHQYRKYIIGRMGIPYEKKKVSIISIAIDADPDIISALAGKLGRIEGVHIKTIYSKV